MSNKSSALFPRARRQVIVLILLTTFLANTAFGAPEASRFLVVTTSEAAKEFWRDLSGPRQFLSVPNNFLAFIAGTGKNKKAKKQTRTFDRIEVSPGSRAVLRGETVRFAAAAFNGNEPVHGVVFTWSIAPRDGGPERVSRSGVFTVGQVGEFLVRASADGYRAEVTLTVRNDDGYTATSILRRNPTELTDAQRRQIEAWRTAGVLTTRPFDTRRPRSISPQQARLRVDKKERQSRQQLLVETAEAKRERGPSAADEQTGAESTSESPSSAARFFAADPLGWDDTNFLTADDRINWVGRPIGATKDAGAGNGNFSFAVPAVSLPGRGLDIDLNLHYNSRLWSKANNEMTYNADSGYPAAGWNLGFGRMFFAPGYDGGCMLVTPDGTRRSGAGGTPYFYNQGGVYQQSLTDAHTTDGSLINYDCYYYSSGGTTNMSGTARMPDGTRITYGVKSANNDQMFPTQIVDRHGNYISISYVNNTGPDISTISDTLGRTITFTYDGLNRLINIKGPGYNGTTRTFIRLAYDPITLDYNFGSLTTSVANPTPQLMHAIYYPTTNTGYWFGDSDSYSTYGMLAKVTTQRGMSWSGVEGSMGSIAAGTTTTQDVYNYPLNDSGGALSDAPTYTNLSQTWDTMDNASATRCNGVTTAAAVTCYSVSTSTDEVITVTMPDGSKSKQTSKVSSGAYDEGRWYQTEILNPSNAVLDKTKLYMAQGAYLSARPTSIEHTDDKSQLKKTEFSYGSVYNQVIVQKEYNYGPTLYREKRFTYENGSSYTNNHIFSLVKTEEVYDASSNRLTRTEYNYDQSALVEASGITHHLAAYDPHTSETVQGPCIDYNHDECQFEGQVLYDPYRFCGCEEYSQVSAWDGTKAYRGNLTSVTVYAQGGASLSGAITYDFTYDVAGNQRTATTNCCQQIGSSYSTATQFSQPDSVTRGSSSTSSPDRITQTLTYDSNTKVLTRLVDANGLYNDLGYDAVSRPTTQTFPYVSGSGASSVGARTTSYNDSSLSRTELVQKSSGEGGGTVSNSTVYFNGRGQPKTSTYQAGTSNHNATQTQYDVMGRQWKVSRPYDTGSSPSYWTEFAYDYLSRPATQTAPDGSTSSVSFSSSQPNFASSSSGTTVLSTDAWGRQRWTRTDAFGRLVEVVEPDPSSTAAQVTSTGNNLATSYTYDHLDRLTGITQGSQTRSFKYDSLGRLTRQKLAEQTATLNDNGQLASYYGGTALWAEAFVYDVRSNLTQKTDARGVRTNLSYQISGSDDPLNRIQSRSYDTSGPLSSGVVVHGAPSVTYEYETTGDKSRIKKIRTAGIFTEDFLYDSQARVSEYKQTVDGRGSYPWKTNYTYDSTDRLTHVEYPNQWGVTGNPRKTVEQTYDVTSRVASLKFDTVEIAGTISYNTSSQPTSIKVGPSGTNQVTENYTFDAQTGLLSGQTAVRNGSNLVSLSYDYGRYSSAGSASGRTGQLSKITDNLNSNKNREYQFDALGRLAIAKGKASSQWTQTYTYDRYGNRTNVTASGNAADGSAIPADGLNNLTTDVATNRITASGYEYDVAGNQTKALAPAGMGVTSLRYEYDAANRLHLVKKDDGPQTLVQAFHYGSTNARLIDYDALGTGRNTFYAAVGGRVLAEFTEYVQNQQSWTKSNIYLGSRLLATNDANGTTGGYTTYHHPDRLGTKLITDAAGTTYEQAVLPFGTALNAESSISTNKQRFANYERSTPTGLDYAVNRTYDSKIGRFTQVDPIGMAAASYSPQSNNLSAYVQNMPTDFVDPSGLNAQGPGSGQSGMLWTWMHIRDGVLVAWHQWFEPYPGSGGSIIGGEGNSVQDDGPCARMAARAQRVWLEVLKTAINDRNLAANTNFNRAALGAFDFNFNSLYTGQVVDGSWASTVFYAEQRQRNGASPQEQGQSDFQDRYRDTLNNAAAFDQTHHFAFHFSAGLNNAALSSYSQILDEPTRNTGDLALTNAAYSLGQRTRSNPNLMTNIGRLIRDEFCR